VVRTIDWEGTIPGRVRMVDQTALPGEFRTLVCSTPEEVADAIRRLAVRGAPAIGVAGALGTVLAVQEAEGEEIWERLDRAIDHLSAARPTAVDLFWALDRMRAVGESLRDRPPTEVKETLLREALAILEEDRKRCREIGRHGSALLKDGDAVLTHCNAGAFAATEYGTALGVIFRAVEDGKRISVFAGETRPLLQGARITAFELKQAGIPVTLICDSAAGEVMKRGKVQAVLVGADRIAANGDAANKIGTYTLSVLAREHGVPFYVAAPASSFDLTVADGSGIPIEERPPEEVTEGFGTRIAPEGVSAFNPAFDVTPAGNITAIVSERGVIDRPDREKVLAHFKEGPPGAR
jgi:methylthioribose-1-phosphate isomerase